MEKRNFSASPLSLPFKVVGEAEGEDGGMNYLLGIKAPISVLLGIMENQQKSIYFWQKNPI